MCVYIRIKHNIICCRHLSCSILYRRYQFMSRAMKFIYSVNLIFIFSVNVLFFFSGICLNSLVILSFWRSVQLRKKLCHFMIMILSCCDLLTVLKGHSLTALSAMLWLNGKFDVYPRLLLIFLKLSNIFVASSLLALLVMNFDRYLATHYPIFHRTSVTKRRLLTLLAILNIGSVILMLLCVCDFISFEVAVLTLLGIFFPPLLFTNYKLFKVSRKSHRNNEVSAPEKKIPFSSKYVSSCLLAVTCCVILSIPSFVYIGLRISSTERNILDDAQLAALWAGTATSMNSTFNCLIFYWKNRILRTEGMKVIKSMKICQTIQS